MADVTFRRGAANEINAVPVVDGQLLWDTTNNIIYMDSGTTRLIMAVGGVNGVRPVAYGGTGCANAGDIGTTLQLVTLAEPSATIAEGANLNSYLTAGVYSCPSATVAATLENTPFVTGAFVLTVRRVAGEDNITQTLEGCCTSSDCNIYTRAYTGGNFGAWIAGGGGTKDASKIDSGTLSADRLPVVPVTKGGTGATTKAAALEALGIHYCESDPGTYIAGDFYFIVGGNG